MSDSVEPASPLVLSREAARRAGLGPLRHVVSTGSTNDDLAGEARGGDSEPAVLVADHQSAGRGRLNRTWSDADGAAQPGEAALLVSLRLPGEPDSAFDVVCAVAAAALQAADDALRGSGTRVMSKWPNDLVLAPRSLSEAGAASVPGGSGAASGKLAGVLSEVVTGDQPAIVVGIGINLAAAPDVPGAVSLADAGAGVARDEFLAAMLDALAGYLDDPATARAALRVASATLGQEVRVNRIDGTSVTGVASDIDDDGRLVVDTGERRELIDSGDVIHLRPR